MQNKFQISFYENSKGATVASLTYGNQTLLDTTHPATIAYALQALGADAVDFEHQSQRHAMALPCMFTTHELMTAVGKHVEWVVLFMFFSQIDSFNPPAQDKEADIHLRTAIHFLPEQLVTRKPTSAPRKNWKKELKFRKSFIYYPFC